MSGGKFYYQDELLRRELYKYSDAPCDVFEDWEISELVWRTLDLIHYLDLYKSGDIDEVKYLEAKSKFKEILFSDIVNVDVIRERVIKRRAELTDYWLKDVERYRATSGYDQFKRDIDNFLRGYNEAVEDILYILGVSNSGSRQQNRIYHK